MSSPEDRPSPFPESHSVFPLVRIIDDCRQEESEFGPDGNLAGKVGALMGEYESPDDISHDATLDIFKTSDPLEDETDDTYPLIAVVGESGKLNLIWGIRSWWSPIDDRNVEGTPEVLEKEREMIVQHVRKLFRSTN